MIGVGLFALALPAFRRYDARIPPSVNPSEGVV
jgi:hypothetical protein